jgi:hypothetical protein
VVDDVVDAAAFEEDVLVGLKLVHGFAEGVGYGEGGGGEAAVFDAGVAVAGDAHAEVERALAADGEAEVGGHEGVGGRGGHLNLDGAAVEREQERRGNGEAFALGEVQDRGLADADDAAAAERDGRGVVLGGDGGGAGEDGAAVEVVGCSGDDGVAGVDVADELLG